MSQPTIIKESETGGRYVNASGEDEVHNFEWMVLRPSMDDVHTPHVLTKWDDGLITVEKADEFVQRGDNVIHLFTRTIVPFSESVRLCSRCSENICAPTELEAEKQPKLAYGVVFTSRSCGCDICGFCLYVMFTDGITPWCTECSMHFGSGPLE